MEKYEIGRTLGEGSFAVVFEARSKDDGTRVAVKRVRMRNAIKQRRALSAL